MSSDVTHLYQVSTHSRPKAAGAAKQAEGWTTSGFNTQPPEGGWLFPKLWLWSCFGFNTQPPEGGWI